MLTNIIKRSLKFQANVPAMFDHSHNNASGMLNLITKKSGCIVERKYAFIGSGVVSHSLADNIDLLIKSKC